MADELGEFAKRFDLLIKGTLDSIAKTVRKAALVADQVVVLATPVDTGRARAGWFASIKVPSAAVGEPVGPPRLPGEDKSEPNLDNAGRATQKAIDQAQKVIADFKLDDGSIFIANNVSYVGILDKGRSGNKGSLQAPNGMTTAAIAAAQDVIRRANRGQK